MWANNQDTVLFCIAIIVQAAAILSVLIARVSERAESQVRYERFFFACLALVAIICLLTTWTGTGSWMMNGFTLATMALGVTIDIGESAPDTAL
ncbi:MAG: hypothetical protein H6823_00705 [Planctomycetaceae bacterium]|nr:hypothetical protein [Planctomycetales bacterium]MCB9936739.1 hypothetical protein [Planctomycetaceae bacterium]